MFTVRYDAGEIALTLSAPSIEAVMELVERHLKFTILCRRSTEGLPQPGADPAPRPARRPRARKR